MLDDRHLVRDGQIETAHADRAGPGNGGGEVSRFDLKR